jgi:clan AA aspartic protease
MQALVQIEVIGSRENWKGEAIVDTGFTGFVSLPQHVAKKLGLELSAVEPVTYGDGRRIDAIFCQGAVEFLGKTAFVPIMISRGKQPLVGTLLLADCSLSIDFVDGKVDIVRKTK